MTDKTAYPPRIWLLPDTGDGGETTWCDDPTPMDGMDKDDAIEYVRADLVIPISGNAEMGTPIIWIGGL